MRSAAGAVTTFSTGRRDCTFFGTSAGPSVNPTVGIGDDTPIRSRILVSGIWGVVILRIDDGAFDDVAFVEAGC